MFVCLFCFVLELKYSWHTMFHEILVYNIAGQPVHCVCSPQAQLHYSTPDCIPYAVPSSLWLIHSIAGSLYLPLPFTRFAPYPLASISLCSVFTGLFLLFVCSFVLFFGFHIKVRSCDIYLSLSDLLRLVPSWSIHSVPNIRSHSFFMAEEYSIVYIYATSSLSIHLSRDSWVASISWLCIMLW